MYAKARILTATVMALAVAGCSEDGTGPDGGTNNSMEGSIQGEGTWDPPATAVQVARVGNTLSVSASHTVGAKTTVVSFFLLDATVEDDYPLNPTLVGQFGQISITNGSTLSTWSTVLAPATGNVELTTLTATRAAGNFTFTGQASPGSAATGQKTVTSGQFDVEF